MDELQELYCELDVPQAAGALFELPVAFVLGRSLHLFLHGLKRGHRLGAQVLFPHPRPDGVEEGVAHLDFARGQTGLDVGLPLPGASPLLEVVLVGVGRQAERAGLPIGAKLGVHPVHRSLAGERGQGLNHHAGSPDGGFGVPVVDEDDVHIAGVVQLAASEFAHADDGQRRAFVGDLQRPGQAGVGQQRELPPHGGQVGLAQQIAQRDPQELAALPSPQPVQGVGVVGSCQRYLLCGKISGRVENAEEAGIAAHRSGQTAGSAGQQGRGPCLALAGDAEVADQGAGILRPRRRGDQKVYVLVLATGVFSFHEISCYGHSGRPVCPCCLAAFAGPGAGRLSAPSGRARSGIPPISRW